MIKPTPLNIVLRLTGVRGGMARSMVMPSMTKPAESQMTAQTAKTKLGLNSIKRPPSAGPPITAACEADVDPATARGRSSADTMFGRTDCTLGCSKARPVPMTKAIMSKSSGVSLPSELAAARMATATASITSPKNVTMRLS